jgi:type II secretory pathway component PulF
MAAIKIFLVLFVALAIVFLIGFVLPRFSDYYEKKFLPKK